VAIIVNVIVNIYCYNALLYCFFYRPSIIDNLILLKRNKKIDIIICACNYKKKIKLVAQ